MVADTQFKSSCNFDPHSWALISKGRSLHFSSSLMQQPSLSNNGKISIQTNLVMPRHHNLQISWKKTKNILVWLNWFSKKGKLSTLIGPLINWDLSLLRWCKKFPYSQRNHNLNNIGWLYKKGLWRILLQETMKIVWRQFNCKRDG